MNCYFCHIFALVSIPASRHILEQKKNNNNKKSTALHSKTVHHAILRLKKIVVHDMHSGLELMKMP